MGRQVVRTLIKRAVNDNTGRPVARFLPDGVHRHDYVSIRFVAEGTNQSRLVAPDNWTSTSSVSMVPRHSPRKRALKAMNACSPSMVASRSPEFFPTSADSADTDTEPELFPVGSASNRITLEPPRANIDAILVAFENSAVFITRRV